MNNIEPQKKSFKIKILVEIAIVFLTIVTIKHLADYFEVIGAGSIAIWCGIIVSTIFMKQNKIKSKAFGPQIPKGTKNWLINILIALGTVILVFSIMGLIVKPILESFGLTNPADVADRFAFFMGKPLVFISYLITVVWFGAALGEELLFRGYLLNRLVEFTGNNKSGIIIALITHAVIFGMLHIYQGLAGVIATGCIALIFGSVYFIIKRKLFPIIIAHGIINSFSLIGLYLNNGIIS
ncbi:CPBP family intramembrane metalloprotease [Winogradskyella litoriviva]|uniref:CPBP family intramembrane metalloprotease n=1 Tax=Winogradskyella litoriviva TaxID=1220182 RepID=A0ABX2E675_9FLAO|nr:CPBP family intramembrane glutamic endopeptidase [Winogradskyella litoriviva]NRD23603.1 CPBP family intramembrane metalloprotease [Winogradskyella litoriviva]